MVFAVAGAVASAVGVSVRRFAKPPVFAVSLLAGLVSGAAFAQALDHTPPRLTAFGVNGSVNAQRVGQSVTVSFTAKDDLSGVFAYHIKLVSPSGREIEQDGLNAQPSKLFHTMVQMGKYRYENIGSRFDQWSEPGVWHVASLQIQDLADNSRSYTEAELAALGPTTFTVVNSKADALAPEWLNDAANRIETPVLSLSASPAGTTKAPLALMSIRVQDQGSPVASGVDVVSAYFCKDYDAGTKTCADAFGLIGLTGTPTTAPTLMKLGDLLNSSIHKGPVTPGVYRLLSVTTEDMAGNATAYVDLLGGGAVDLSSAFLGGAGGADKATITVTP